jgi:hypothetical protein
MATALRLLRSTPRTSRLMSTAANINLRFLIVDG